MREGGRKGGSEGGVREGGRVTYIINSICVQVK